MLDLETVMDLVILPREATLRSIALCPSVRYVLVKF